MDCGKLSRMAKKKLLLFDIDGTLLVYRGAASRVLNATIQQYSGLPANLKEYDTHGKTDLWILEEVFARTLDRLPNATELQSLRSIFITEMKIAVAEHTVCEVFTGVRQLLDTLSAIEQYIIGIETGNFEETALFKLELAGLAQHFKVGGFGCDHQQRSLIIESALYKANQLYPDERIQRSNIVVIGDTPYDMKAARTVGARALGVTTGAYEELDLLRAGAHKVVSNLENIDEIFGFIEDQ